MNPIANGRPGYMFYSTISNVDAGYLKDPGDGNATSFQDPLYLKWVLKALDMEKRNPNVGYISAWLNGGFRSYDSGSKMSNFVDTEGVYTYKLINYLKKSIVNEINNIK